MRKLLCAVSAVAIGVAFGATAQAADLHDADVNIANIAINIVPGVTWLPAIDASVNISADDYSDIEDIGNIKTNAIGAANLSETFVGRDNFTASESVTLVGGLDLAGAHIHGVTSIEVEEGGLFTGDYVDVFHAGPADFWSIEGRLAVETSDSFSFNGVPETNVLNLALNFERIDGSVNVWSDDLSDIGNIGNIKTSAIGAVNQSITAVGVPGNLGQLGLGIIPEN